MSTPPTAGAGGGPGSPRSPRPDRNPEQNAETPATATTANGAPPPPPAFPDAFVAPNGPPPRPNLGSMFFMTAMFFMMSNNNRVPNSIVVGPDGTFERAPTELDRAQSMVDEYKCFLNGTDGAWEEPSPLTLLPSALLPQKYAYGPHQRFFKNISGFYRDATVHPLDLVPDHSSSSASSAVVPSYFDGVHIPSVNASGEWNETQAESLRGSFPWSKTNQWEMTVKERKVDVDEPDWSWVQAAVTLTAADESSVEYGLYGLHYVPNATYSLFGLPNGLQIDIRNIPLLFPEHSNITQSIILGELEKELAVQMSTLMPRDAKEDDEDVVAKCPLLVHLTIPPLPPGVTEEEIDLWDQELQNPTGLRVSLPRPPSYWDHGGFGAVAIADQCGWAMGIENGVGMKVDEFWDHNINYATIASISQLIVLVLFVRQMEHTRTPSTLTRVSILTVVMMGIADSWVFSAHIILGVMSNNRTSLPLIVPGFLCLCSAIVFSPRYAVLLHRIQAPESPPVAPQLPPPPATAVTTTGPGGLPAPVTNGVAEDPPLSRWEAFVLATKRLRPLGFVLLLVLFFQIVFLPAVIPFVLFILFSFWVPQIWRNARKGTSRALDHAFIIGTAAGRLVLPLYVFAYPENIFFVKPSKTAWVLVGWQVAQVLMLFAQERFGPAFFLPKRFAPEDAYDYHPIIPPSDAENAGSDMEKTCSICMEEVDTRPGASGEVLLGMSSRRAYALAPCHHLFHTKCLNQWLAIKTICPLCKRSLPPL